MDAASPPTVSALIVGILILAVLASSAGAAVVAAVWWLTRDQLFDPVPASPRRSPQRWPVSTLVITGLFVSFMIAERVVAAFFAPDDFKPVMTPTALVLQLAISGVLWTVLMFSLLYAEWRHGLDFGIWPRELARDLRAGLWGFMIGFAPTLLCNVLLRPWRDAGNMNPLFQLVDQKNSLAIFVGLFAAAAIAAPLLEELVFRVILQNALVRRFPAGPVIVTVAVMFAMVHGWPDALALIPLALILGYVFHRRQSYLAVVVIHALFNGTMLTIALLALAAGAGATPKPPAPAEPVIEQPILEPDRSVVRR